MTLTSRFTNAGLDLLADWTANPAHAKPFSIMKLGTLSDTDYSSRTYDGSETDIKNPSPSAVLDAITVAAYPTDPAQAGSAVAKVTGVLQPNESGKGEELRGERIREIGLFVEGQTAGEQVLVWIGTFPDQYIPTYEESSIDVQMSITVPVKFDNAAAVQVVTDNTLVEQRVTELENDVQTMNGGSGDVTPKASQADMEKAAQCINKLNVSGTPGTSLPDIGQIKLKADKDIVGDVPTYPDSYGTPTKVQPGNVWDFVKQMNNGAGTAGNAQQKANQSDFTALQKYARKMNTGDETGTAAAQQKANQTDFENLLQYARIMNTGSATNPAAAKQKVNQTDFNAYKQEVAGLTASIVSSDTHPLVPDSAIRIRVYADLTIPQRGSAWTHTVSAAPVDVLATDIDAYIALQLMLTSSWKCVFSSDRILSLNANDVLDLRFFEYVQSTPPGLFPMVITAAHMQFYRFSSINDGSIGCCSGESTREGDVRMRCLLWQPIMSPGVSPLPVVFSVYTGVETAAPFIRGFAAIVPAS